MSVPFNIAIVDDDASVALALCRLMHSAGFEAGGFHSAAEFMASVAERLPDCLILDVQMPGRNGLDLQEDLLARGFDFPIVFITAYDDEEAVRRANFHGAAGFLRKPVASGVLIQTIRRAIESKAGKKTQ